MITESEHDNEQVNMIKTTQSENRNEERSTMKKVTIFLSEYIV